MGKKGGGKLRRMMRWTIGGCLLLAITGIFMLGYLIASTPSPNSLRDSFPKSTAFIDRERNAGQRVLWAPIPYDQISDDIKLALLVSEDINFFHHHGFELHEIREAISSAFRGKRLRGASTLSQQLAKNLWLSPDRSFRRKVEEAILTLKLERTLSKKRILQLYLNCVEFGPGIFGVEAASEYYFHKPASEIRSEEAARLIAALPSPSRRHPGINSKTTQQAVDRILFRMERAQWIQKFF